jgi:hypothetical protein
MGNQPVATENLGSPGKPGRRLTVRLFDRWALPSGLPDCFALPVVGNFTVSHSKIAEKRDSSCGPARVRGLVVP